MIKTLFYFFLLYLAYKVYRLIKHGNMVYKSFHYHQHQNTPVNPEGEITIKENPANKKVTGFSSPKGGDYIDYEELKD